MKILIDRDQAKKLRCYSDIAEGEVSGLGKSITTEDGDILITNLRIFKQVCTSSTTDIDKADISRFANELENSENDDVSKWNVWWHTHANHDVFWSSKDDETISDHAGAQTHLVSIVTNKKNEFKGRLDIFPQDNSGFKKSFKNVQYDLDVEIVADEEEIATAVAKVEGYDNEINKLKEAIDKIETLRNDAKDGLIIEDSLVEQCIEDIEQNVSEKVYETKSYPKKDGQSVFEDNLYSIMYNIVIDKESDIDKKLDSICPDCGNSIVFCTCPDAEEKHEDLLYDLTEEEEYDWDKGYDDYNGVNDYLKQKFNY